MIFNTTVKNVIKSNQTVASKHLVVAEWNMNKSQKINQYGIYTGGAAATGTSYTSNDAKIVSGKTFYIYEDDTLQDDENIEYFSGLESVFKPDRPDPGIVLMQYYPGGLLIDQASKMRGGDIGTDKTRFYAFSKERPYDYFNSAKLIDRTVADKTNYLRYSGISNINGAIENANPFVVYENAFPCNKLVFKVQNHLSVPEIFYIDILPEGSSTWQNIYTSTVSTPFQDGILELYYYNSAWSTTVSRLSDFEELAAPSVQLKSIRGIRMRVAKMTEVSELVNGRTKSFPSSLELIEISPRIEADMTQITEQFSISAKIPDSDFGLPVGGIMTSTGDISISNENKKFLYYSNTSELKMLSDDVEFRFYQLIENPSGGSDIEIILATMFSDAWNLNEDFSVKINLKDRMKIFQETKVMDMLMINQTGTPMSILILLLLDNLGITGYEFKKSNNANSDSEDIKIPTFFCNKEQTLAEVLEQIAVGTQSAMFFDPYGRFNVLTKERIARAEPITESTSETSTGTDFWMIYDEDYSSATEQSEIQNYKANVVSAVEEKIDPITDGTVQYNNYGIKKLPGFNLIQNQIPKDWLDDNPFTSLVNSGYEYSPKLVWTAGDDSEKYLGAANLISDISDERLTDLYTDIITAENEEAAVRQMVNLALQQTTIGQRRAKALLIYLDRGEIATIGDFSGYVMIDGETIEYNGVLYSNNGANRVIFSKDELNSVINANSFRGALIPIALVVQARLRIQESNTKYEYRVIGDGRGRITNDVKPHTAFNETNTGLAEDDKFALTIGARSNAVTPGNGPKTSVVFSFANNSYFESIKRFIGLPADNYKTYLGYLRMSGQKPPTDDIINLEGKTDVAIRNAQENTNINQVDPNVPGTEFDPFVYTIGERRIYGQKIDLSFFPNYISTTMRLYSPRKTTQNGRRLMTNHSSIAGIGFGLKTITSGGRNIVSSGYFIEVESFGFWRPNANEQTQPNLRFYKIQRNADGVLAPKLLAKANVDAFSVSDLGPTIVNPENDSAGDPVFDLQVKISYSKTTTRYQILYGGRDVTPNERITEKISSDYWRQNRNIFMFVRNDSEALYENIIAAVKTSQTDSPETFFQERLDFERGIYSGVIPLQTYNIFQSPRYKIYFNDFSKLVRQVRRYTPRYKNPVLKSKLIDVSRVNPQYMVVRQSYTSFGADIFVANTSNTAIALSEDSALPLYIYGPEVEKTSEGTVSVLDFYKKIDSDGKKITDFAYNRSLYGIRSFNINGKFVQSMSQANNLMKWILTNCSRQRLKISLEIFSNPLLELGDKVKIFSVDRGYQLSNNSFGNKTFIVSEINRSVDQNGTSMNIEIIEVGE